MDRRSYLMFIMLITCQSLFKIDDEVVAFVASAGFLMIAGAVQFQRRRRRKRTVWEKPWIQVRPVCGACSSLISDLRNTDESAFHNYLRINVAAFEESCCHGLSTSLSNSAQDGELLFARETVSHH